MSDQAHVRALARKHEAELFRLPHVVGVGVGHKNDVGPLAVIVNVERKVPERDLLPGQVVPREIDSTPTDVVEVGVLRVPPAEAIFAVNRTDKIRPAPGGVSIGHVQITAGTLGAVVRRAPGRLVILSNNHVLANSNAAQLGDPIIQPGAYDGGAYPGDWLANLVDFVPIQFDGDEPPSDCPVGRTIVGTANALAKLFGRSTRLRAVVPQASPNLVDAAIAVPLDDDEVLEEIIDLGRITGLARATPGMAVRKSGRTTGTNSSRVSQTDTTVRVQYGAGKTATFADQFLTGPMSAGGDSGSAVLGPDNTAVGLLFAGSEQITVCNQMTNVAEAFGLVF